MSERLIREALAGDADAWREATRDAARRNDWSLRARLVRSRADQGAVQINGHAGLAVLKAFEKGRAGRHGERVIIKVGQDSAGPANWTPLVAWSLAYDCAERAHETLYENCGSQMGRIHEFRDRGPYDQTRMEHILMYPPLVNPGSGTVSGASMDVSDQNKLLDAGKFAADCRKHIQNPSGKYSYAFKSMKAAAQAVAIHTRKRSEDTRRWWQLGDPIKKAAFDAERQWQADRLIAYLIGEVIPETGHHRDAVATPWG